MARKSKAAEAVGRDEKKNMEVNAYGTAHHPYISLCYATI
jgi:hypothetical protein